MVIPKKIKYFETSQGQLLKVSSSKLQLLCQYELPGGCLKDLSFPNGKPIMVTDRHVV